MRRIYLTKHNLVYHYIFSNMTCTELVNNAHKVSMHTRYVKNYMLFTGCVNTHLISYIKYTTNLDKG